MEYTYRENTGDTDFFAKTRTVFLYGEINGRLAQDVGTRLKYLDYLDEEAPITMEIYSPGGDVTAGLAILDTMQYIAAPVRTVVCGMAASMAAVIAAAGEKGMRYATPHSTVMIHQPLGGTGMAQASDIDIYAKNILRTKALLCDLLAEASGHTAEEIEADTDRDCYMNAEEAVAYGLLDGIIRRKGEKDPCPN